MVSIVVTTALLAKSLVAVVKKSKATEREAKTMLSQTIRPFLVLTRCICCHPWRLVLSQNSEKLLLSLFSLCVSSPRRLIFRRIVWFFNAFEQRKSLRKKRHVSKTFLKALAFVKNFMLRNGSNVGLKAFLQYKCDVEKYYFIGSKNRDFYSLWFFASI